MVCHFYNCANIWPKNRYCYKYKDKSHATSIKEDGLKDFLNFNPNSPTERIDPKFSESAFKDREIYFKVYFLNYFCCYKYYSDVLYPVETFLVLKKL